MITLASITDGSSNTLSLSEGLCTAFGGSPWNRDVFGFAFNSQYPPNYQGIETPASPHPGGINVAFVDGSVHFIKNSINTWPLTIYGTVRQSWYTITITNGYINISLTPLARPGVWQALSTRANGEVISSDSY
jgi:prepilin-type processing-associated H-X9-DG protein